MGRLVKSVVLGLFVGAALVAASAPAGAQLACSADCMKGWNHCTNKGQKLDVCFQALREGRLVEACNDEKECHPAPICSAECEASWKHCLDKGQAFEVCLQALREGRLAAACSDQPSCLPHQGAK